MSVAPTIAALCETLGSAVEGGARDRRVGGAGSRGVVHADNRDVIGHVQGLSPGRGEQVGEDIGGMEHDGGDLRPLTANPHQRQFHRVGCVGGDLHAPFRRAGQAEAQACLLEALPHHRGAVGPFHRAQHHQLDVSLGGEVGDQQPARLPPVRRHEGHAGGGLVTNHAGHLPSLQFAVLGVPFPAAVAEAHDDPRHAAISGRLEILSKLVPAQKKALLGLESESGRLGRQAGET